MNIPLKHQDKLPALVIKTLSQHSDILYSTLSTNLVGIYVHGSAAMGGFNYKKSDLDYLVIINSPLTLGERNSLSNSFQAIYGTSGFKKGVEMSIVEARFVGAYFRYPTPYEFHMGTKEQILLHGHPPNLPLTDHDLACHFVKIYERGICVYGKDIESVFAPFDKKYYWRSIYADIITSGETILIDPIYTILNLCRTVYEIKNNEIYSKQEGAHMYLDDQLSLYKGVVQKALNEYTSGTDEIYNKVELFGFVDHILATIEPTLKKLVV